MGSFNPISAGLQGANFLANLFGGGPSIPGGTQVAPGVIRNQHDGSYSLSYLQGYGHYPFEQAGPRNQTETQFWESIRRDPSLINPRYWDMRFLSPDAQRLLRDAGRMGQRNPSQEITQASQRQWDYNLRPEQAIAQSRATGRPTGWIQTGEGSHAYMPQNAGLPSMPQTMEQSNEFQTNMPRGWQRNPFQYMPRPQQFGGGGNPFANFQQPQWQQPTRPQQPANQWWLNTIGR